jgi:hypothetical protein
MLAPVPRAGQACEARIAYRIRPGRDHRLPRWRRAWARRGAASRGRLLAALPLRRRRAGYPAVTFLRSSWPVMAIERGLACSCTGMDRVSTPAL